MRKIELTLGDPNNYFVREAFNTMRTNILFSGKNIKTVLVTSCLAHEGKTTISFEMARSLADTDKKVLFIDADLRKSMTASRYTAERGIVGLSQILSGQIELQQAVYRTQIPSLDMIFAGPFPPNPAELVGSPAFHELLDCVRDAYDYIIIDAPPLGMVIDAAIMSSVCDGAVIVINQGNIKYRMAQNVKAQLTKSGCRILGVVLNQTQRKARSMRNKADKYYRYSEYYGTDSQNYGTGKTQSGSTPRPAQSATKPASTTQRPATGNPSAPRPAQGTGTTYRTNKP